MTLRWPAWDANWNQAGRGEMTCPVMAYGVPGSCSTFQGEIKNKDGMGAWVWGSSVDKGLLEPKSLKKSLRGACRARG